MKVLKLHEVPLERLASKTNIKESEEGLKTCLLQTIDESLNQILGGIATQKIYLFLEEKRHLKIEDIPNNLEDFQVTVNEIFGRGALVIEKTIMENLYSRLSISNEKASLRYENKEQFNFVNYINDLKSLNNLKTSTHSPKRRLKRVN